MNTIEFQNKSTVIVGRSVSTDLKTRILATHEAHALLEKLPKHIKNNPQNSSEIQTLQKIANPLHNS